VRVTAKVGGNLARPDGRLVRRAHAITARAAGSLQQELEDELRAVSASGRAADPEARRDALERAVRRLWGAPL
jgi:hypothetical protein